MVCVGSLVCCEWLVFGAIVENAGIGVDRAYCGSFITSLEMAGVSLTIMHLDDTRTACLGNYQSFGHHIVGWVGLHQTQIIFLQLI